MKLRSVLAGAAGLCLSLTAILASAAILDEVVVTATKREATVQDLPFSINAQTQADIQRAGAMDLEDLSRNVAGLAIQNLGPGQSQVSVRGVSAGEVRRDQPGVKEQVGVYLDESVISLSLFTPDLDLFDLNRVETLRGPQGTLFGSGSVGGTLRYITNQPNPDAFEGLAELNLNAVDDGDNGGHLKAMLNIPLADGRSAVRIVGYATQYAGFVDALGEGGTRTNDVNDGERTGGRIAFMFQPTDNLTITPRLVYQEVDMDGFARQEVYNLYANPFTTTRPAIQLQEREQFLRLREGFNDETLITDLTLVLELDAFDITSITSYTNRDILVSRDASALTGSVSADLGFTDAGILLPSNLLDETQLDQITQEIRFSSNAADSAVDWQIGLFMSKTDRFYTQTLPTPGYDAALDASQGAGTAAGARNGVAPPDSPFASILPYDLKQFAAFAEATFDLSDRTELTLGGRYYDFDEERNISVGGFFSSGEPPQNDTTSSSGFTPRVMASYDLNDDVTLNAQVSQGFRLGGVNDPLNTALCTGSDIDTFGGFQAFDDETMWNYEVGFKARLSPTLTVNAAVFHADIEDLQVTLEAGTCSSRISFNVPDAHTTGVELEVGAQPMPGLTVTLAGSYLEAEFDSTVTDDNGDVLGGVADGNRIASVPELQGSLTASYDFQTGLFGAQRDAYVSASIQHVGDRITQPSDQVAGAGTFVHGFTFGGADVNDATTLDLELESYELINVNAGVFIDKWEAVLYVNNLTDENANLAFNRERDGRARLAFFTNEPRTYGLTLRRQF